MPHCHIDQGSELALHALERRREKLAPGDDHDIDPAERRCLPEYFAHPSLGQIAINSSAKLLAGGNADPRIALSRGQHEYRHEPAVFLHALVEDPCEFTAAAQAQRGGKSAGHALSLGLGFVGYGEALAPLGAPALQHQAAILGRHANQEPMGLGAAPGIRLERTLPFCHLECLPRNHEV
jgi:hypothetical protein